MSERAAIIETDIPARLDRLPWTGFHTLVVAALGITWILDGLEVTLAGSVAGALQESPVLRFSAAEVGAVGSAYLVGAVFGALLFGYLTDRFGRRKLFFVTLGLYLTATAATAFSWDFASFALFRLLTGAGIGGEYSAINSAIQELVPARFRGRTDLAINGSFWLGAALGAFGAVTFLQPGRLPPDLGWRVAFGIGAALGLGVLLLRRHIPESPRWLMLHDRLPEAERVIGAIERRVGERAPASGEPPAKPMRLRVSSRTPVVRMALGDPARLSAARGSRRRADVGAGVFLQRDLLFLCPGPDPVLRRRGGVGRLVHPAVCAWQLPRSADARPAVRHRRPQADDRRHLRAFGRLAGGRRLAVPREPARRGPARLCAGPGSSFLPRRPRAPLI